MSDVFVKPARLGVIVPSTNTTVETELRAALPTGTELFTSRVLLEEPRDDADKVAKLSAMKARLAETADTLRSIDLAAVAFACTSGSFIGGRSSDEEIEELVARSVGAPAVTTSGALVEALTALRAARVALVTPYVETVSERAATYLTDCGFGVVAHRWLGLASNLEKGRLPASASFELGRSIDASAADVVVIACTNWATFETINPLGEALGKPVISSNLATAWALLRRAGLSVDGLCGPLGQCSGREAATSPADGRQVPA